MTELGLTAQGAPDAITFHSSAAQAVEGAAFVFAAREFNRGRGDRSLRQVLRSTRQAALITVLFEDAAACAGRAGSQCRHLKLLISRPPQQQPIPVRDQN